MPPSASSTSQSTQTVRSPNAARSVTARSERPMSRWISWVRPPTFPALDSRCMRVFVARGSIAYSAVTQPRPVLRRNCGTFSSTLAAQRTVVPPTVIRAEPSALRWNPVWIFTGRSSFGSRPSLRFMRAPCCGEGE